MSNTFITSDNHFWHDNIRRHCNRPWPTIEEMNEALIKNWNSVVTKRDLIYHLGDFAMIKKQADGTPTMKLYRSLRHRLNGRVILIKGNHDKMSQEVYSCFTEVCEGLKDIKIDGKKVTLCHYPMQSWNCSFHGAWHLHGHCHCRLPDVPHVLRIDVGVDNPLCNYTPFSWDVIKNIMMAKEQIWTDYWNKNDKSWRV